MKRFCTITGAAAVLAGLACSDAPTTSSSSVGPPGLALPERTAAPAIAFVSNRDGSPSIHVADPDGSNLRRLAEGHAPAWSWDGRKIAFVRGGGIHVMDRDGSDLTYVGPGSTPAWSPDGRIAFSLPNTNDPTGIGLYVMNADGSGVTELLSPSWLCTFSADCARSYILWPTWSPDGQRIAFHAWFGGNTRGLGIVNADGSDPQLFQELLDLQVEGFFRVSSGVNTRGAWSSDGFTIAVITGNPWLLASYPYLIYTYAIASGDLELIHTAPPLGLGGAANNPEWASDGTHILFDASSWEGDPRGRRRIFAVSLETSAVRQLIPDAINALVADYSDWGAVWSRANR